MSISSMIELFQSNFLFALVIALAIGLVLFLIYILLKKFNLIQSMTKTKLLIIFMFIIYIIFVCSGTLIRRHSFDAPAYDLSLFHSYKTAWYEYSLRAFQLIFINISLFIPLGVFLPLLHNKLKKWLPTLFISIVLSTLLEALQLITHRGVFEIDGILNKILGALIGFGIIMIIIKRRFTVKTILYLAPLLLVLIASLSVYMYYQGKEFGNLSISAYSPVQVKEVSLNPGLSLSDKPTTAMVYKAPTITREEAKKFAYYLYEQIPVNTSEVYASPYQNQIFYRYQGNPAYLINVHLLDSTFSYTDSSHFKQDAKLAFATEAELKSALEKFNISIPDVAEFNKQLLGEYSWTVDHAVKNNQLINGRLSVTYFDDNTIKYIDQRIVYYDEVRAVPVITEQEAYTKISKGKFNHYNKKVNNLTVTGVELSHSLDSKGYYQPVYRFEVLIDGESKRIHIPAIK